MFYVITVPENTRKSSVQKIPSLYFKKKSHNLSGLPLLPQEQLRFQRADYLKAADFVLPHELYHLEILLLIIKHHKARKLLRSS